MNVAAWLHRSARVWANSPALMRGEAIVADYREFARRAAALGGHLKARYGINPGDRVAIFMSNATEYFEALYAAWWIGAVAVPINAKLHPKEAAWIIEDSGAKVVFVSADIGEALLGSLNNIPSLKDILFADAPGFAKAYETDGEDKVYPASAHDLAWLFYTSGTTGRPKGVMLTHGNLAAMTTCYFTDVDEAQHGDANIYAAPISHGAGLYNFMQIIKGARHVVPESGKFDPSEILSLSRTLRDTTMFLAPTMVRRLVDVANAQGSDGDGIKTVVYGGAPMYLSDIEAALATLGQRFSQIYGQGESPMTITALSKALHSDTASPKWRQRLASVGVPQSLVEVRIAGEDGAPLPPGEVGEVIVRGPSVMAGYWGRPEATAETLRDGWLWTGDMGEMDEDGFLTLRDRSKDVIISGGTNIYPREVEEVLLTHPSVSEVAVVGKPHPDWGEEVVAFVVLQPGASFDPAAFDRLCLDNIARFKRPKAYHAIESLPKSNYGKVLKTELRKFWIEKQIA